MRIGTLMLGLAGASLISIGPALAQGRGGGQGGGHGLGHGVGARTDAGIGLGQGRIDGRLGTDVRVRAQDRAGRLDTRTRARAGARAPERAAPRAIERADDNSVLHDPVRVRTDLAALAPGLVVRDSSGVRIGTVSRVLRSSDGSVANVLVRPDGERRTLRLAPGGLTLSGDVVTTTEVRVRDED